MSQFKEFLTNPSFYIIAIVIMTIIQMIPQKIIKARPIEYLGRKIGKFFNGCDIKNELKTVNMKIDINDFQTRRNRVLSFDMLLRKNINYKPSRYDYENIFDDIEKLKNYKEELKNKYNIITNGELRIAIDNIENKYRKEVFDV